MPSVYSTSREHFEQRMRARRAATCLAVARSAIASGRMVEAVERLEEACALDPEAGEARLLLEELRLQESESLGPLAEAGPATPRRSQLAGWSHWIAAGVAIGVLAGLAYLWPDSGPETGTRRAAPVRQEAPARQQKDAPATEVPSPGLAVRLPAPVATSGDNGFEQSADTPAPEEQGARSVAIQLKEEPVTKTLPIVAATQPPSPESSAPFRATPPASGNAMAGTAGERQSAEAGGAAMPAVTSAAVSLPPPPPPTLPSLERVAIAVEEPKPVPATDAATASTSSAPAGLPGADDASMSTRVNETGQIEQTLGRYADAYTRLDARAARAVWPTVDQRALARAFEGLESQGIVFEHCDVVVAGVDATAACRGRAQYVPKVGSREPLVQRRQWTFRLHKADNGWQIVQAEAR